MKFKVFIYLILLFASSSSNLMSLNRLWKSFSARLNEEKDKTPKRASTQIGQYKDFQFTEPLSDLLGDLALFNASLEGFRIKKITLRNLTAAFCSLKLVFNNSKVCFDDRKKISNKKACLFLKKDSEHKILFDIELNLLDLKDSLFYEILPLEKKNEFELIVFVSNDKLIAQDHINIKIQIYFSTAFNFNLSGFRNCVALGNVIGFILNADDLDDFDYSELNARHLIFNKKILI
ncbi:MAG: hypothetical protein ABIF12_03020 [bacterium]